MNSYFAPMEGITDATYRELHHKYFPGVDRYYMPFFSPTIHRHLTPRESRELPTADSVDFVAIPQLLGKNLEDMLWAIDLCGNLGYGEVNINLGCPSGTVVSKGKGSGMLAHLDELDAFLNGIYSKATLPISLKTRIGVNEPEEFGAILEIYNQYPVAELTIHPRVRKAFYKGPCHMDVFSYAVEHAKMPLCYNGNVCSQADIQAISDAYPTVQSVMIGRALVADPGMLTPTGTTRENLEAFLTELSETYCRIFGSSRNAIYRLKDNWHYLITLFDGADKPWKELRKTTDYQRFCAITQEIIHTLPMKSHWESTW